MTKHLEEIKEILDKLKNHIEHIQFANLTNYELRLLLDYIINLQQENETRQQDINNLTYQLAKMKEENERLKDELENKCWDEASVRADILLEQEDYKSRCLKVSEKINYYKYFISLTKSEEHMLNTLDNILQNGSGDNE